MTTHLPFAFPIRVPDDVLVAFGEFTGLHWNDTYAMEPLVCEALRQYMQPAPAAREQAAPSESGYQWKAVFLPEGTRLRASFHGKQYFAVVAGAEIKYGEQAVSPSCFANLYGSGNRNAWKAVWLRLPGSNDWLLADVCRSARKAAIARLMGGDADQSSQSSPAVPLAGAIQQPTARQPNLGSTAVRASNPPGVAHGDEVQHKKGSSRSARRQRGKKKHISGNPR